MTRKFLVLIAGIFTAAAILTQSCFAYEITTDSIKSHVYTLAADSMAGRQVGTAGEMSAARYLIDVMKKAGLEPGGRNDYLQAFEFVADVVVGENPRLVINGVELKLDEDYRPLPHSASGDFEFGEVVYVDFGISVDTTEGSYDDYADLDVKGRPVIVKRFAPEAGDNPHIDFEKYSSIINKINTAVAHEAGAVILVTPEDRDDTMLSRMDSHVTPKDIPIIYLKRHALERLDLDLARPAIISFAGDIEMIPVRDTGYNVIGRIDTGNDTVIVIGAHYDHLGWGTSTSLYAGPEPMIHNGADDNGSGTATMLELARYYATHPEQMRYSMVFCGFSGEEAGLIGSSTFARSDLIDTTKVRLMVNMDMVGRLHEHDTTVAIFGIGSAAEFQPYFDSLQWSDLKMSFKEPGTGPSDQTAFYNRGVPVLYFFTGAHEDYHKPSDDADLVDYSGIKKVADLIVHTVDYFDDFEGSLTFQQTADPDSGKRRASYSVTLGIMPDYVAEVKGLRVDGIVEDRPGQRGGILKGDVIIKMGDITIGDIYDYMNALGKFRKGDTTIVIVERGDKEVSLDIVFE